MTDIILSKQQESALSALRSWYKDFSSKHSFILNGYAGTGKTTVAKLFPEIITEQDETSVLYAALTGKAALQLRRKGCENATTLHKLLYSPLEKDRTRLLQLAQELKAELIESPLGDSQMAKQLKQAIHEERKRVSTPSWQLKPSEISDAVKLIVVDESSMIDQRLYNDLIALNRKIVFLGDPFQLPPVFGTSPVMSQEPDFVLTEVHRQAWDNPILRAATELRKGVYPSVIPDQDKFVITKSKDAGYETYASADQVLCGRNKTRGLLNSKMRKKLVESGTIALSTLPAALGDKIVFLRNDHDEKIFNGGIAKITSVTSSDDEPSNLMIDAEGDTPIMGYDVWAGLLDGQDIHEAPRKTQIIDHAYALTVHKAQGSEWPNVVVHNEPVGHGQDALRWLYTAITRAQDKCTVVTKEN